MPDRPAINDLAIAGVLRDRWGLAGANLVPIDLGRDPNSWSFRARVAEDPMASREDVFVKIRRTADPVRLAVARFLAEHDVPEVVAPIPTLDGELLSRVDDLAITVFPFVEGRPGADGLDDGQWIAYGSFLRRLHASLLQPDLAAAIAREAFDPRASAAVEAVDDRLGSGAMDPISSELAQAWQARRADIGAIAARTDGLAASLRAVASTPSHPAFVVCHADIHTWNVLVTPGGELRVVDWDDVLLAPAEHDLMYVVGTAMGLTIGPREVRLFSDGYGPVNIDKRRLAYYRYRSASADIAGYAIETLSDVPPDIRGRSLGIFLRQLEPGALLDELLALDVG